MHAFRKSVENPSGGAQTLPQRYLISQELFAKEKERIFSTQWLCVGHQSQIPNAGDYFTQEVVGESLIILRDRAEDLRGFYNVCRHRGTRLCEASSGQGRETLRCPYHGWTYN